MWSRGRFLLFANVFLIPALLLLAIQSSSAGGELVLVVHANNKENPNTSEAKRLFLGDSTFWPANVPVKLFVRPPDSPAADAFFHAIQIAPARFRRLWQEKQLSGQGTPPETIASPATLVAKVAADPGGIGIALADELPANPPGVRVVALH